jgi:hypothetical protein
MKRLIPAAVPNVDIQQVSRGVLGVIAVRPCALDVTSGWMPENPHSQRVPTGWAREAPKPARRSPTPQRSWTDRTRLGGGREAGLAPDAVAASVAASRDLLQTHLANDPGGERELHSE